jgi:amino acid adenylation domain-containing protein/thioester reductase-like protein
MAKRKPPYWNNFLKEVPRSFRIWLEGVDLINTAPTDTRAFAQVSINLKKSTLQSLKKTPNLSLTTRFHAAFGLLLNRFSSQDNILYCTGRLSSTHQKLHDVILHSYLPVTSALNEQTSLLTYQQQTEKQLQQNNKRMKSFNLASLEEPLEFNYLLVFADKKKPTSKSMLTLTPEQASLMLMVSEKKPTRIKLLYCPEKFTQESAKNIVTHYAHILEKLVTAEDQPVTHFSMLTNVEKEKLLSQWNQPKAPLPKKLFYCVHDLFSKQATMVGKKIAVQDQHSALTYRELDDLSNQLGMQLIGNGVYPGDSIAVLMDRTPSLFIAMLALFKIGAIYVPINPKYPEERIGFIIEDCQAKTILTDDLQKVSREFADKIMLFDLIKLRHSPPTAKIPTRVSPELVAYIIYTSGTTGQPKGVMIQHISLINLAIWYKTELKITPRDRSSQFASQGFDSFFCETIPYLTAGASIHIVDDHIKLTPSLFLPWLSENKITILDLPTVYSQILFPLKWPKPLYLRMLKIGGEALNRYPTQTLPFDIWNIYGPTETTVEATFNKIYRANIPPNKQKPRHTTPPIGKPMANLEAYIVDERLQPVPIGIAGELLLGGLPLSIGYIHRQQLTREKFIRNHFSEDPEAKLYRTGDLVRWLSDGNIEYIGRIDQQIKISGYRIELTEINATLHQYPDVNEVLVLMREIGNIQKTLVAYVVPNLNKIRIPYQERCLLAINEINFIELLTEDFSKEGVAITGLPDKLKPNQTVSINLKLPGMNDWHWFSGRIIWQQNQRAGIVIDKTAEQKEKLNNCVNYHLATNNLVQTLYSAAAKRSLRKALKKKLPDYMIPTSFTILPEFPLTLNGKVDAKALPPPQDFERLLERNYVPPRTSTEAQLTKIWNELLHQDKISITDNFFDLGGTSLQVSQLSIQILDQFNISVPAKILFDLPFIPILAEYIDSKGKKFTFKSSIQEEINQDAFLSDSILPCKQPCHFLKNPKGVLLTGAGGFLGIYLLRELLKITDAKIYCLIRKGEFETPAKRLVSTIENFHLGDEISLANRRIIVIDCDLGKDKFGLSAAQYDSMAEKVDVIYHCGAQVNTMASYPSLRNSNVLATIEVLKFATHKVDKAIHYISTLSAAYKLNAYGELSEEFPDTSFDQLTGGYAISKWVSERLITQIKTRGLPVSIFRSGYIFGQSDTGVMNTNDALLLLMKGCIQLGFAPDWNESICILPVDFVSHAIVNITLAMGPTSMVFHLDHPKGIMWQDLVTWLNNYGYKIKICPHKKWLEKLMKITPANALYRFLPHYLSLDKGPNTPKTALTHANLALKKLNITYPDITDEVLRRFMNYLCEIEFMPKPYLVKV